MSLFERRKARKAKQKDLEFKDPSHKYKVMKANPRKGERLKKRGWEYVGGTPGKPQKNVSPIIITTRKDEHDDSRNVRGVKRDWTMKKKLSGRGKGSYQNTRSLGGMSYR